MLLLFSLSRSSN